MNQTAKPGSPEDYWPIRGKVTSIMKTIRIVESNMVTEEEETSKDLSEGWHLIWDLKKAFESPKEVDYRQRWLWVQRAEEEMNLHAQRA